MQRQALAVVLALSAVGGAQGADLRAPVAPVPVPTFTWSGAHVGIVLGGGSGTANFRSPSRASLSDTNAPTPFAAAGGRIGYDHQVPFSRLVLGVEADGGAIGGLNGATTCLDTLPYLVPFNCRTHGKALATGTGRLGYAFGPGGRTLGYVKGGVAALFENRNITAGNSQAFGGPFAVYSHTPQVGFTVGAGVEQALSNAWSVRLEYDNADFGTTSLASPPTQQLFNGRYRAFSAGRVDDRQSLHAFKLGLDYHLGASPDAPFVVPTLFPSTASSDLFAVSTAPVAGHGFAPGYSVEIGGRAWYSFGRFQKDLASSAQANNVLRSRLTYRDTSSSGEFFGRIDTPARIFVKGFIGGGGEATGHLNDEDFRVVTAGTGGLSPYSNALLSQRGSTFAYGTIDLGYAFLKTESTSIGAFAGYNRYKDVMATYGCIQLSGNPAAACGGNQAVSPRVEEISQNNGYNSLRLGLNGDIWLDRLRVQTDAAYLPVAVISGADDHFPGPALRSTSGHGQGVQLELITSYYLTRNFSVGVGGRFWGLWDANSRTFYVGSITPQPTYSQRFGLTTQAAYRFDALTPTAVATKY